MHWGKCQAARWWQATGPAHCITGRLWNQSRLDCAGGEEGSRRVKESIINSCDHVKWTGWTELSIHEEEKTHHFDLSLASPTFLLSSFLHFTAFTWSSLTCTHKRILSSENIMINGPVSFYFILFYLRWWGFCSRDDKLGLSPLTDITQIRSLKQSLFRFLIF